MLSCSSDVVINTAVDSGIERSERWCRQSASQACRSNVMYKGWMRCDGQYTDSYRRHSDSQRQRSCFRVVSRAQRGGRMSCVVSSKAASAVRGKWWAALVAKAGAKVCGGQRLKGGIRFGANGRGIGLLQRQKAQQNSPSTHSATSLPPSLSVTLCHALAIEIAPVRSLLRPTRNPSDSNKWANVQSLGPIISYRKKTKSVQGDMV